MNEWNINNEEGDKIIKTLLTKILLKKVNKEEIPLLMKKMAEKENIIITRNNKKRNINNYIKIKYGNFDKMYNNFHNTNQNLLRNSSFFDKYKFYNFKLYDNYNYLISESSSNGGDGGNDPPILVILLGLLSVTSIFFVLRKNRFFQFF